MTAPDPLRAALAEIREVWAGAECGEPVYAQEAYAIRLCKQMYGIAVEALAVQPIAVAPPKPPKLKPCDIRMCDSSAQPEESLRCKTCGHWTSEPCAAGGIAAADTPTPPAKGA